MERDPSTAGNGGRCRAAGRRAGASLPLPAGRCDVVFCCSAGIFSSRTMFLSLAGASSRADLSSRISTLRQKLATRVKMVHLDSDG
ncbi:hypothetical protein [Chania multitudinisentens]|uniref:hypothetical protein n=1 Tax=Chania multitudinisentens TaxID=1639108 RepID=UPI001F3D56ED|nr:hypothetical protein [Chania multitudinisentens]